MNAKLVPSDEVLNECFGRSVAVDGDTIVVGAYQDDDNGTSSGSAYVFTRTGSAWTEQAKLLPADGAEEDNFGSRVALDGDTAVIAAFNDDDNGTNSGSAYVFRTLQDDSGDVPAANVIGTVLLLLAMLGSSVYFMRRRAAN
jgi:hypothetical protein